MNKTKANKEVYLFIVTKIGILAIPCVSLVKLDQFTVKFDNIHEMVNYLINVLDLKITIDDVSDAYIYYEYRVYDDNKTLTDKGGRGEYPIKYREDNYNVGDLREKFTKFLCDNKDRIKEFDIRHMEGSTVTDYFRGDREITDEEIKNAVWSYFKEGYINKRRIYFKLKYAGVKVLADKVVLFNGNNRNNVSLTGTSVDDEYFTWLTNFASLGDEEYDKVMDIVSSYGLDELNRIFEGQNIVDGMGYRNSDYLENIMELERLSGLNIDDLNKVVAKFSKKGSGRGK